MGEFSVAFEIDPIPTAVVAISTGVSLVFELSRFPRWTRILSGR